MTRTFHKAILVKMLPGLKTKIKYTERSGTAVFNEFEIREGWQERFTESNPEVSYGHAGYDGVL